MTAAPTLADRVRRQKPLTLADRVRGVPAAPAPAQPGPMDLMSGLPAESQQWIRQRQEAEVAGERERMAAFGVDPSQLVPMQDQAMQATTAPAAAPAWWDAPSEPTKPVEKPTGSWLVEKAIDISPSPLFLGLPNFIVDYMIERTGTKGLGKLISGQAVELLGKVLRGSRRLDKLAPSPYAPGVPQFVMDEVFEAAGIRDPVHWVRDPAHNASEALGDYLNKLVESHRDEWTPTQVEHFWEYFTQPSALIETVAATVPYMAATIAAFLAGGPALSGLMAYAVEGQGAYEEAIESGATSEQAELHANIVGVVTGITEQLPLAVITGKVPGGKKALAKLLATKIGQRLGQAGSRAAVRASLSALAEGSQESVQRLTEILSAAATHDQPLPETLGQWVDETLKAAIPGAAMGAFAGAGAQVTERGRRRPRQTREQREGRPPTPTEAEAGEIMQERAAWIEAEREARRAQTAAEPAPEVIPPEKVAPEPAEARERPPAEEAPAADAERPSAEEVEAGEGENAQDAIRAALRKRPSHADAGTLWNRTEGFAADDIRTALRAMLDSGEVIIRNGEYHLAEKPTPQPTEGKPPAAKQPAPETGEEEEKKPTRRKRAAPETEAAKKKGLGDRRKAGRQRNKLLREIRDFYRTEGLYDLEPPRTGAGRGVGEFGDEITEGSFDFDTNFGGKIPGELTDHFPRGRIPAKYRKLIKANVPGGLGEEVLHRMGAEAFIARLDDLAGGKRGEAEREVAAAERWAKDTGNTAMLATIERYRGLKGADTLAEVPTAAKQRIISEEAYQAAMDYFSQPKLHGGLMPFSGAEVKHAGVYILYHIENGITRLREITKAAIQDWKARYSERETRRLIRQGWRKTRAARQRVQEIGRAQQQAERRGHRRVRKADIRAMVEGVEEPLTMTPSRLLAYAMKKAQTTATLVERATARDIIRTHKTLLRYAQSLGLPKGEIGKVAMAVASAKTIKQQMKVALAIEQLAEHYKHREAVGEYKKQLKRLQKKYGRDFERMFPNYRDLARELTAPIDPSKPTATTARRLAGTLQHLKDHPEVREEMPDHVFDALERLNQTPLSEMTADEIGAATNGLRMILRLNEVRKTLKRKKLARPLTEAKADVLERVGKPATAEGKQIVAERGVLRRLADTIAKNLPLFSYAIDNADAAGPMSVWVDGSLHEAEGANILRREDHIGALLDTLRRNGIEPGPALRRLSEKFRGRTKAVRTKLPNGTIVTMSPARRVALYLTIQQPEGRAAVQSPRGWIVDEVSRRRVRWWRTREKQVKVALQLTEADLEAFEKSLTPMERRLAKAAHEYLTGYAADAFNRATVELYDYEKATNPDYFPLSRYLQDLGKTIADIDKRPFAPASVENWSANKPRTGGTARLVIPDVFEVLVSQAYHIAAMETYGRAARNVNALLADSEIADAIDAKHGDGTVARVRTLVRRIYGQAMQADPAGKWLTRFRGNTAGAILALRISTAIKQALSLPIALNEMGWRHMGKYLVPRPLTGGELRTARRIGSLDYSPTLWARRDRGKMSREFGDFIAQRDLDRIYTGETSLREMQGVLLKGGDSYAIDRIMLASYSQARAELGKQAPEPAVMRRAAELAESVVRWTQPTWSQQDRTLLGGTPNELLKGVTMFRSFLDKVLVQGNKSLIEYQHSDHGTSAKARYLAKITTLAVAVSVLPYMMMRLYRRFFRRERPEDVDPTLAERGLDNLEEMAGVVPGGRGVVRGIRGYAEKGAAGTLRAVDIPHIETANDLVRGTGELVGAGKDAITGATYESGPNKGEAKWKTKSLRGARRVAAATGRMTGYSAENIWDLSQSLAGGREYPRAAYYEALARAAKRRRTATVRRWLEQLHKDGAAWSNINTSLKGRDVSIEARRAALVQWRDIVKK